jgi:hypothetical protein
MKLLYFALACILLFSALSTVALAIPEELAWVLSDDETELYYGSKTFTLYEPYFPLTIVGDRVYGYDYALNDYRSVDTNDRNAVYAEVGVLRYVTEEGTSALDRLMEGEASSYMLMSQYGACGEISDDLAAKLTRPEKGAETRTFDVRDLEDALYYTLLGVEQPYAWPNNLHDAWVQELTICRKVEGAKYLKIVLACPSKCYIDELKVVEIK